MGSLFGFPRGEKIPVRSDRRRHRPPREPDYTALITWLTGALALVGVLSFSL